MTGSLRTLVLSGLLSVCAVTASLAGDGLSPDREWGNAKGWQIFWNEARQSCFAATRYQDETIFWIGLNRGGEDGFIAAANAKWDFVRKGEQHKIRFVFDGNRGWNGEMSGTSFGDMPALEVDGVKVDFIEDVARSNGLRLDHGKNKLTSFSLKGTRAALDGVAECTRVAGGSSGGNDAVAGSGSGGESGGGNEAELAEALRLNEAAVQKYDAGDYSGAEPLFRRVVEIHELTLIEQTDDSHSVFEAECGKGTYVRALARDIGRILGRLGSKFRNRTSIHRNQIIARRCLQRSRIKGNLALIGRDIQIETGCAVKRCAHDASLHRGTGELAAAKVL